jgi:DHA2 family multidrug resistance protein
MRVLQVIGLPFLFVPISTLAFTDVPKEKSSKASAIFAMARNLGGSVGIAAVTSYVVRHQQIHQAYLSTHLSNASSIYEDTFARYVHTRTSQGNTLLTATHFAMGRMYHELLHQANLLAFGDAFRAMAVLMGTLAIVALFMPYNTPNSKKPATAVH